MTEETTSNVKELTIKDTGSKVGDITIQYEEGMTWNDWLSSSYNRFGFEYDDDNGIWISSHWVHIVNEEYETIQPSELIGIENSYILGYIPS